MKKLSLILALIFAFSSLSFAASFETVKVDKNDNLKTISAKYLKSDNMSKDLLKYNKLNSPADIKAGMTLKIPYSLSKKRVAKLVYKLGQVEFKDGKEWKNITMNQVLIQNDVIKTSAKSKANIMLDDGTVLKLGPSSELSLANYDYSDKARQTDLKLDSGSVALKVTKLTKDSKFNVKTVTAVAGVRGTKFFMSVNDNKDVDVAVYDGKVEVTNSLTNESSTLNKEMVNKGFATRVYATGSIEKPYQIPGKIEWNDEE